MLSSRCALIACMVATAPFATEPATAAPIATKHAFDLPAGPLANAIIAAAGQSGITIGTVEEGVARIHVPRLRGLMTVDTALRRLLAGTGYIAVRIDARIIRIERARIRHAPIAVRARPSPANLEPPPADIVVTASKQGIALRDYPGSAQVVTLDDTVVQRSAGRGTSALVDQLPFMAMTSLGAGRDKLFVRGIADSSFTGPTQSTVGQYLGESRLSYNAPDPNLNLYDIERAEILEGPQGTLYGAGSMGGIVRLIPHKPVIDQFQASLATGVTTIDKGATGGDAAAMVNLPVGSAVALRLVGYRTITPGYIDDVQRGLRDINRSRSVGGRTTLRIAPGNGWTVDIGGVYQSTASDDGQYSETTAPPLSRASAIAQPSNSIFALGQISVRKQWSDGLELMSNSSLVRHRLYERYDATDPDDLAQVAGDGLAAGGEFGRSKGNKAKVGGRRMVARLASTTNLPRLAADDSIDPDLQPVANDIATRAAFFSHETRVSRNAADGQGWVVGANLIIDTDRVSNRIGEIQSSDFIVGVRTHTVDAAVFGQGTFALFGPVHATLGGRWAFSQMSSDLVSAGDEERDFGRSRMRVRFLPTAALSARIGPGTTAYVRYQQGYRAGGVAVGQNGVGRFRPDTLEMAEAGVRFGRSGYSRFSGSIAVSYARWRNIQADLNGANGPFTANIGNGRIYGLEAALEWRPVRALTWSAALFVNDSGLTEPSRRMRHASRDALPNTPRLTARSALDYRMALDDRTALSLHGAVRYVGRSL